MNIPIVWTQKSIRTIDRIMNHINNTKLIKSFGYMVKYYINKHEKIYKLKEWKIVTIDNIKVKKDSLILAYVLELYLKNKKEKAKIITSKKLIYKCLKKIILEITSEIFAYETRSLNFEEVYLVNLISEMLFPFATDNTRRIAKSAYFATKYLMSFEDIIYDMNSLIVHAESMDLNIIPVKERREIMNILNTKRTLYLRILLIICFDIMKQKYSIGSWLKRKKFNSSDSWKEFVSDDIVELIFVITGNIISLGIKRK